MKHVIFLSLLLLCSTKAATLPDSDAPTPAALFIELFAPIDSIAATISEKTLKSASSRNVVDSAIKNIIDDNLLIQGIALLDNSGIVINNGNRTKNSIALRDPTAKDWFTIPRTRQISCFGGVVRANANNCFLKSYPCELTTDKKNSNGVLVVLVDAALFLEQLKLQLAYPFTVRYKSVQLYSTTHENTDLPAHSSITGYDNLEISYGTETIAASIAAAPATPKSIAASLFTMPWLLLYLVISLLLGILSFMCGRYYHNQSKYRKFLEMEYEKISKEQQKQIHDRALSQVYCEVKRQIETHEIQKIEDEIRHKIEHDIEEKILVN